MRQHFKGEKRRREEAKRKKKEEKRLARLNPKTETPADAPSAPDALLPPEVATGT